jgi:hypothetical protein
MNDTLAAPNPRMRLLRGGATEPWTPQAKGGRDLPFSRRAPVAAEQQIGIGETFDSLYTRTTPGELSFELRSCNYQRLFTAQPIHVLAAAQPDGPDPADDPMRLASYLSCIPCALLRAALGRSFAAGATSTRSWPDPPTSRTTTGRSSPAATRMPSRWPQPKNGRERRVRLHLLR